MNLFAKLAVTHHTSFMFWSVVLILQSFVVLSDNTYDWKPSVSLTDDFDEPVGFCVDIVGWGSGMDCNSLQVHSCKASGDDTQFEYQSETKTLRSVNYNSNCDGDGSSSPNNKACVVIHGNVADGATLGLTECDDLSENQKFEVKESSGLSGSYELRAGSISTDLCLVVSDTTRIAGPHLARDLFIGVCSSTDTNLKTWAIAPSLTSTDTSSSTTPAPSSPSTDTSSSTTPSPSPPSTGTPPSSSSSLLYMTYTGIASTFCIFFRLFISIIE